MVVIKVPGPIGVIKAVLKVEEEVGDFIANGPADGIGGHVRDEYRKRCNQFSNAPGWAQALTAAAGGGLGRICKPYWDGQGTSAPVKETPFEGGQCSTAYNVNITYTAAFGFCENVQTFSEAFASGVQGPISVATDNVGTPGGGDNICEGFSYSAIRLIANGAQVSQRGSGFGTRLDSLSVVRADGLPDDCGDPPAELKPGPTPAPNPGPTPGPEPTNDPSDPTGIPLLPIPDYEDPIGGPTPIVGPDPNEPTLDPTSIPGPSDSQEGSPENVGQPIEVDPGISGGGNGTDFGLPPDGKAWVGCLLRFTIPTELGSIAGSGPTQPVSPRVFGNASLVFSGGLGTAHRCNSASISLVRPSGALKVTGVYVNVAPGFTYTVRPVAIDLCPENTCGA